jgi:hypothetical protein
VRYLSSGSTFPKSTPESLSGKHSDGSPSSWSYKIYATRSSWSANQAQPRPTRHLAANRFEHRSRKPGRLPRRRRADAPSVVRHRHHHHRFSATTGLGATRAAGRRPASSGPLAVESSGVRRAALIVAWIRYRPGRTRLWLSSGSVSRHCNPSPSAAGTGIFQPRGRPETRHL